MKYVLFTGATGGLGTLCVKELSKTGQWTVFAAGNNQKTLHELGNLNQVIPIQMDVTSQESVNCAYQKISTYTRGLDAIVNFAGVTGFISLIEGNSIETVEKNLDINLIGMVRVNRTFFEMVHCNKGRIINCSSESGWMTPSPFAGPYVLSKYAVEGYNDSLRRELLYLDIPVIKIQPGAYDTKLTQNVSTSCDNLAETSRYYKRLMKKMKPLLMLELQQKNNPAKLVKVVMKALTAPHPKLKYRVGTSKILIFLELLTDRQTDCVFKLVFNH